jgi:hypothetical protein
MEAKRDQNSIPTLIGVSNVDGVTPVLVYVDPVTHRVLVDAITTSSAGGLDTYVQFNDGGTISGDSGFVYNKTTKVSTIGAVIASNLTASMAVVSDANKKFISSATTAAELAYVSGVTSAIQTQLDGKAPAALVSTITFIIDGGGSAITTGVKGDLEIPFACTINQATLLADQSGSIVIDVWKDTYANFAPTVADTITASAKPTLSTAIKAQDATLTGWTKTITAGDILRFNVDSATTVTRVTLSIKITRT